MDSRSCAGMGILGRQLSEKKIKQNGWCTDARKIVQFIFCNIIFAIAIYFESFSYKGNRKQQEHLSLNVQWWPLYNVISSAC